MTTVFIVEDDISIVTLYELFLESNGFKTIRALNGERALEIYKALSSKPDIILMDHRMPLKSGLEAAREIKEIDHDAKIIFISADGSIRSQALLLGAISFIEKPFDYMRLIDEINIALNI